MTIVGHSIMGLTLGAALLPRGLSKWKTAGFLVLTAAMACLPDWRVPFHSHLFSYDRHHSLLVNCTILALVGAAMAAAGRLRTRGGWLLLGAMFAAAMSHLLLDSFYSHANGVNIGWPFGKLIVNLPIPWLHVQKELYRFDWYHIRIRLMEILTFGPLLAVAVGVRMRMTRRRTAPGQALCNHDCRVLRAGEQEKVESRNNGSTHG